MSAARPARCPACGVAAGEPGNLAIYGHGRRERQQRGPAQPGATPIVGSVLLRRYQCQECKALITCAPQTVQKHKLYSACAIAWALGLFGLLRFSPRQVRERTSPWSITGFNADRWASLTRWAKAVEVGALFSCVRRCPEHFTLRQVSERAAAHLATLCPSLFSTAPPPAPSFYGAAQAR